MINPSLDLDSIKRLHTHDSRPLLVSHDHDEAPPRPPPTPPRPRPPTPPPRPRTSYPVWHGRWFSPASRPELRVPVNEATLLLGKPRTARRPAQCVLDDAGVHVGLAVVAIGKYVRFVEAFARAAARHFMPEVRVTLFLFSDQVPDSAALPLPVRRVYTRALPWPWSTMMRFQLLHAARKEFAEVDYIFSLDVDLEVQRDVCAAELLGERVATLHPGFVGKLGTPETRPESTAFIPPGNNKAYFAGGIYGGTRQEVLDMAERCTRNIETDLARDPPLIATWHDESHLNRYFFDHPPTKILSPSYCYPEGWVAALKEYEPKIVHRHKDHAALRE